MNAIFVYPERQDNEPENVYWQRVCDMGIPFPWETDKAIPPGPIAVTHEWSLRSPDGSGDPLPGMSQENARKLQDYLHPNHTLVRRVCWVAVGGWEDAEQRHA
jgi:hypothetical protein